MTPKKPPKPQPIEFSGSEIHWLQGAAAGIVDAASCDPDILRLAKRMSLILQDRLRGLPSYQAIQIVEVADS